MNQLSILLKLDTCYNENSGTCDPSKNGFRLPSEAEWEYSCRAGSKTTYFFGNNYTLLSAYAVFDDTSKESTFPVGCFKPNNWKIHDMCGNVFEWCQDLEPVIEEDEDSGSILKKSRYRIIRGGGFGSPYYDCRSANRGYAAPRGRFDDTGFRLVKTVTDDN